MNFNRGIINIIAVWLIISGITATVKDDYFVFYEIMCKVFAVLSITTFSYYIHNMGDDNLLDR